MAMTGSDLWLYTQGLIDKDFSDYVSGPKANRMFKKSMYNVIEQKLSSLDSQKIYDELSFLIKSGVTIIGINSDRVNLRPMMISSVSIPLANTISYTTHTPHNLIVGDVIVVSNVGGIPLANGSFIVSAIGSQYTFSVSSPGASGVYTSGGEVYSRDKQIVDYMRLLSIKAKCLELLTGVYVTSATNTSTIKVTLSAKTNIRTGMQIKLVGVNGNGAANGTFYVKQLSSSVYELYTDEGLTSPVAGTGTFTSSVSSTVYSVWNNYCTPQFSSRKISSLSRPSAARPMYDDSSVSITILHNASQCTDVEIDYVRIPPVDIDVLNSSTDLSLIYPQKFLYSIADAFAVEYSQGSKDDMLYKTASVESSKNP